ncbi:MAG: CvpA family protein [Candidatus Limiplasma sp.]|nr:CvpA family protein [Candidatus Limiplasma sp.]
MNIIDFIVIGIVALCVLFGFYRGFIQSVLNLGGCLLSFVGSFLIFPKIADAISGNTDITRMISSYTDSSSLLGSLDLSSQAVSSLTDSRIAEIVQTANLPTPVDTLLSHNLSQQVFSPLGNLATNVGDYVNQTILSVSINVLSFLVCFVGCFVVLTILTNLLRAVFRFPVLKQLDWLAGGLFGFMLGMALCFVAFTTMPLLESVLPIPQLQEMVQASTLAKVFENGNLLLSIMNRRL